MHVPRTSSVLCVVFANLVTQIGGRAAGSCTAALFLKSFVDGVDPSEDSEGGEPGVRWAHLDIAGTMEVGRSLYVFRRDINVDIYGRVPVEARTKAKDSPGDRQGQCAFIRTIRPRTDACVQGAH